MGDTVGISAIAVLLALLVGAELLGFAGVLLAVPAAAVLKILLQRLAAGYRRSNFYTREDDESVLMDEASEPPAPPSPG